MSFISRFKEYCSNQGDNMPTFLRKDEKTLNSLILEYGNKNDFKFLCKQIKAFRIGGEKYQIIRNNSFEIINKLKNKFSSEEKSLLRKSLIEKIVEYKIIGFGYSEYFKEIHLFFELTPQKEEVISAYKIEKSLPTYKYFFDYCTASNNRVFFETLLEKYIPLYENEYKKNEFNYFTLIEKENLKFIVGKKTTQNKFLKLLGGSTKSLSKIFDGYYIPKEEIFEIFKTGNSGLVKNCIFTVIKQYSDENNYIFEGIIKGDLFGKILSLQKSNKDFVNKIFSFLSEGSHQYHPYINYILKIIISQKTIDNFFSYNRSNRTILSIYYMYSNDIQNEALLKGLIYEKYQSIINYNNQELERNTIEKDNRLTQEELKIKEEIIRITENVTYLQNKNQINYFSERILYLYINHKDLFDNKQKQFVLDQINLYFTCKDTNLKQESAKIIYTGNGTYRQPGCLQALQLGLKILLSEDLDIFQYIDRIIYLIPYLYDFDYSLLSKHLKRKGYLIKDKNIINWILDVYSLKKHGDLGLFHSNRIITLFQEGLISFNSLSIIQLTKLSKICENMIKSDNKHISFRERGLYIDFLIQYKDRINCSRLSKYENHLRNLFVNINYFDDYLYGLLGENGDNFLFFCKINAALILIEKNDAAIQRRLNQLYYIKKDYIFKEPLGIVHSVSPLENEYVLKGNGEGAFFEPLLKTLKYKNHETDLLRILAHAKDFDKKDSKIKPYLYSFVSLYYKTVPKTKQIDVYTKLNNKEFVLYYLGAIYWNTITKKEYKNKSKELKLKNEINNKENEIKELEKKVEELKIIINEKNDTIHELENKVIIFTEGKTDWKHLKRMANELILINPKNKHKYSFFLKYVQEYNTEMGYDQLEQFLIKMAEVYNNYMIIGIIDPDGKNSNTFKEFGNKFILKHDNLDNLRLVKLTNPWQYGKKTSYYDDKKWCIELMYNKKRLKDKFIIPRDMKFQEKTICGITFGKSKFKGKNIYTKDPSKLTNIYDYNSNEKFSDEYGNRIIPPAKKEDFAQDIYLNRIKLTKSEIMVFSPIFDVIYQAYIGMQ